MSRGLLVFVVQKHKATSLHYDFRLEVGGVMPSWSIPKGPSMDSRVKRLAMPTSDHTLEYRTFEGSIPRGSYGAGPVMIWDTGTYTPEFRATDGKWKPVPDRDEADALAAKGVKGGDLKFTMYGKKLKGSFALVRMSGFRGKAGWLLIKHSDRYSVDGYDANDYDFSAVSGLTLEEIARKVDG